MASQTREYKTKEDVLRRAKEAIGIPLGDIDKTGRLDTGKGAVGTVLEESWFGYTPNSKSEPDFPEAGVELKAVPYLRKGRGRKQRIRAKERLVCNIIDYNQEVNRDFFTSSFWRKCETMLLMSFEHVPDGIKKNFHIDEALLFSFPAEDLKIIREDWEIIRQKIADGKAHELSESDTRYLAACTKGANSKSVRQQPNSEILAKQRAYSLKSSYMTEILNSYFFGTSTDEKIIRDVSELKKYRFEDYILEKLELYYGMTQKQLSELFSVNLKSKNANQLFLGKMLGLTGRISDSAEFKKSGILPKTIRVQRNGKLKEHMSFPSFKFIELLEEDEWEESTFYQQIAEVRFMLTVFTENSDGEYVFTKVFFWNMPTKDVEQARLVWERTKEVIRDGVILKPKGKRTENNLPGSKENPVAHVRPHGADKEDTWPLPDGRELTKQCFWLNKSYLLNVLHGMEREKTTD